MTRYASTLGFVRTIALFLAAAIFAMPAAAQEAKAKKEAAPKAEKKAERAKPKGRLPANYSKLVDDAQRAKIYDVQAKFAAKKDALKAQLEALAADETAEIEAVLTPEQKQKLVALQDEAKAKKSKTAEAKKAGGDKKDAEKKDADKKAGSEKKSDEKKPA